MATVQPITTRLMQKWLCCYGYARRGADTQMTGTVLEMEAEVVRPIRRPQLRYMDTIRRYTKKNGLTDVNSLLILALVH